MSACEGEIDGLPVTVITGATSGIGLELARLASREGPVLLVARSASALETVAAELRATGAGGKGAAGENAATPFVAVLPLDLAAPGAPAALMAHLEANGLRCERLVNNAAFGLVGPAAGLDRRAQEEMVALNVAALTSLTLAVLPGMMARRRGGVLNVSSVASFLPGARMAVYYATKAFVTKLSEALWQEAREAGVVVTALCPGPVHTNFIARATGRAAGFRLTTTPFHVPAAEVARQGWEGFRGGRRLVVPGLPNRLAVLLARFVPPSLLIAVMSRYQSSRPSAVR